MLKKILAKLHLLLTPDVAHKAVFTNVPLIGFKNDRSLEDHLARAVQTVWGEEKFFWGYINQLMILPILKGETPTRRLIY